MASPIKDLQARQFLNMLSDRKSRFAAAPDTMPAATDGAREIARALHPKRQ